MGARQPTTLQGRQRCWGFTWPHCRQPVSQQLFMSYFWPLYARMQQLADDEAPLPAYFRFLTLLGMPARLRRARWSGTQHCALRSLAHLSLAQLSVRSLRRLGVRLSSLLSRAAISMFLEERVDVAVLEVGLGGRLDATNCIPAPVVCGISHLGMDHMELLGNTLRVWARGRTATAFRWHDSARADNDEHTRAGDCWGEGRHHEAGQSSHHQPTEA